MGKKKVERREKVKMKEMRLHHNYKVSSIYLVLSIIPLVGILVVFFMQPDSLISYIPSSSRSEWKVPSTTSANLSDDHPDQLPDHLLLAVAAQAPLLFTTFPKPQYDHHQHKNISPAPAPAPPMDSSSRSVQRRSRSSLLLDKLEARLAKARGSIRQEISEGVGVGHDHSEFFPRGPIYKNPSGFHRSYLEMEKLLKIYVYEEGEVPMFHDGPCKSIYSTEGRFIHEMEKGNQMFRTRDPERALLYFLPFSVVRMVQYLYQLGSHDTRAIRSTVVDYVNLISHKHPFWNRTLGADHFMLSCHDWGPTTSSYVPNLFHKSIRVLCNANTTEGFKPWKDVSFPEINLRTGEVTGLGGPSPSKRSVLAFFAGRLHGHIRYLLLNQWKNKDTDVQVYDQLPRGVSYDAMLRKSRFCLCPSGYEVASPRVVEAIYADCVPVLISDGYVPPFSDVLNWKAFSVVIKVKDIPNIKDILMAISTRHYLRMQRRVKLVQRHFVLNDPPKRYDVFHMTLHSLWLRRLNIRVPDSNS